MRQEFFFQLLATQRPISCDMTQRALTVAWRVALLVITLVTSLATVWMLYMGAMQAINGHFLQAPSHLFSAVALAVGTTLLWAYRDEIIRS